MVNRNLFAGAAAGFFAGAAATAGYGMPPLEGPPAVTPHSTTPVATSKPTTSPAPISEGPKIVTDEIVKYTTVCPVTLTHSSGTTVVMSTSTMTSTVKSTTPVATSTTPEHPVIVTDEITKFTTICPVTASHSTGLTTFLTTSTLTSTNHRTLTFTQSVPRSTTPVATSQSDVVVTDHISKFTTICPLTLTHSSGTTVIMTTSVGTHPPATPTPSTTAPATTSPKTTPVATSSEVVVTDHVHKETTICPVTLTHSSGTTVIMSTSVITHSTPPPTTETPKTTAPATHIPPPPAETPKTTAPATQIPPPPAETPKTTAPATHIPPPPAETPKTTTPVASSTPVVSIPKTTPPVTTQALPPPPPPPVLSTEAISSCVPTVIYKTVTVSMMSVPTFGAGAPSYSQPTLLHTTPVATSKAHSTAHAKPSASASYYKGNSTVNPPIQQGAASQMGASGLFMGGVVAVAAYLL